MESDYLGRVYSVLSMLSTPLMPLGMLVFGPLADKVRIETLLVVTGTALIGLGLWALVSKRLQEAGAPTVKAASGQ